ncbi:MAG: HD domain-containing protein [Oscillospiraceae bacterium]|nr:HD domain-containing protein [Oscillospiraceae bacterium]
MGNTDSTMALIERADSALYRAKFLSNSKVEIFASVFDKLASIRPDDLEIIDAMKPVRTLITAINSRDRYTYSHVERVVLYCEKFCNYIDMDFDNKRKLICAAYLHDLGKVNISKELLISEKAPTDKEWELLKKHPADSAKIISEIPEIRELMPLVRSHHERYDGGGYPDGLKGEDIPYLTRIITLADSFDAMTHHRPYKKIKTEQEAFEDIRTNSGTQFDPELTEIFIEAMEKSDKVTI